MAERINKNKAHLIFIAALLSTELAHSFLLKKYLISTNSGFVFGLIRGNFLASIISVIFLTLLLLYVRRRDYLRLPFILIASGAVVNILDRVTYGGSQDYINLWSIPTFNIPDIIIVFGGYWFLLNFLLHKNTP